MLDQVIVDLVADVPASDSPENIVRPKASVERSEYLPFPDASIDFETVEEIFEGALD